MDKKILIVGDAGGTSTQWRVIEGDNILQYETIGFNAYTHSIEDFKASIVDTFGEKITKNNLTYLYAAGIETPEQSIEISSSMQDVFGKNLLVKNDLLGVTRSLCGKESSNVCILGTGSNACVYDGKQVKKVGASLGYILGDEGSGAYLGKIFLTGIYRNKFSKKIIDAFINEFHLPSHEMIQHLYHQPKPNHFLASFSPFIYKHRNELEIYTMVFQSFMDFFKVFFGEQILTKLPFHFSGSIAWFFSDILKEVGNKKGVVIKKIVQSPISGLALYHQKYG